VNCDFAVEGELWQTDRERSISLTAAHAAHFVQA
jgi:hypothetical protein